MTVQVVGVDGLSVQAFDVQVGSAFERLPLPYRMRVVAKMLGEFTREWEERCDCKWETAE